jgi:hypothetical protein
VHVGRFLDDLIFGALGKWSRTRAEVEADALAKAMTPHWPNAPLLLPEAVELLDRTVDRFLDETLAGKKPRLGIKGAAAIGKTGTVIRALGARPGIRELSIEVYAPDHKLTAESAARQGARSAGSGHLRAKPRGPPRHALRQGVARQGCSPGRDGSLRAALQAYGRRPQRRAVRGVPIFQEVHGDPLRRAVPRRGASGADHGTRQSAAPPGQLLPEPDMVIIDETFWREAVDTQRSIGIDRLTAARPARQFGRSGSGSLKTAFNLAGQATKVRDALLEGRPLLAELRQAGHSRETIADMARAENATIGALNLSPAMSDAEIRRKLDGLNRREVFARARLWKILRDEIDTGREQAHGLELRRNVSIEGGERQDRVFLHHRRPLPRLSDKAVLLLDADLNREIAGQRVPGVEV